MLVALGCLMVVQEAEEELEHLQGMLSGLQISKAERRGFKGAWLEMGKGNSGEM